MLRELYNKIFNKKITYKCVAYINTTDKGKDSIFDAFEIKEYSYRRAYKETIEILRLKYPNKMFEIKISKSK